MHSMVPLATGKEFYQVQPAIKHRLNMSLLQYIIIRLSMHCTLKVTAQLLLRTVSFSLSTDAGLHNALFISMSGLVTILQYFNNQFE